MKNKNFIVTVKCGHVGRNRYIEKKIPIIAVNGRKAARKAKKFPRVKKHLKDCILNVEEVNLKRYKICKLNYRNDPYFQCENMQDQRRLCPFIREKTVKKYKTEHSKKERVQRIHYLMKKREIEERQSVLY